MASDAIVVGDDAPGMVHAHPIVLLAAIDQFMKRPAGGTSVIGLLLGRSSGDELHVTNTVPMSHSIVGNQINLDPDLIKQTLAVMTEVDPTEELVGWYNVSGDGAPLDRFSIKLHDFFASAMPGMADCPILLTIDASLRTYGVPFYAYTAIPSAELAGTGIAMLQQMPVAVSASDAERTAVSALLAPSVATAAAAAAAGPGSGAVRQKLVLKSASGAASVATGVLAGSTVTRPDDLAATVAAMSQVSALLAAAEQHVGEVVAGRREGDPTIGTAVAAALASVPRLPPSAAAAAVADGVSDLAMTSYLTSLTTAQIALSDRISGAVKIE